MKEESTSRFARVAAILKALAINEPLGLRLSELVLELEMPKTTVYRLTEELVAVGFVAYERDRHAYHLGDAIDVLARRGSARFDLRHRVRPFLERLVGELGDTAYLMVVRDDHLICVDRLMGNYPIQSLSLDVGDVRPVGVGSSGAAVAARMDEDVLESLLRDQSDEREALGIDDEMMRSIVERARADEVSFNPATIVPGMSGMGISFIDSNGAPQAAVSVVAINPRFANGRARLVSDALQGLRRDVEASLGRLT